MDNHEIDTKDRLRSLKSYFLDLMEGYGIIEEDIVRYDLNGYEGMTVYLKNGHFVQFRCSKEDIWSAQFFPYDLYGKYRYVDGKWLEK